MSSKYQEVLHYLFSQLPMYQRQGISALKKTLDNITSLCRLLDNPQDKFKSIHVAGTNGKGSVTHILASYFMAKGLKVGIYTSPHYKDFRERIKINGQFIPENEVVDFVLKHKQKIGRLKPSFFEWTVALAFNYFASEAVDIAIIETGLGGRLDSTNIITPQLSVITNIGLDHQSMLGHTLDEIADEKAGIIKHNVPVVIGESQQTIKSVFIKKAKEKLAEIYFADQKYKIFSGSAFYDQCTYNISCCDGAVVLDFKSDLEGPFQAKNILTAFVALEVYHKKQGLIFQTPLFAQGLANFKARLNYIGRWEILGHEPLIIADSAHNIAGLEYVLSKLNDIQCNKLIVVLGVVNDKDLTSILPLFPINAYYYFVRPNVPRGLDADKLSEVALDFGLKGEVIGDVFGGLTIAMQNANAKDCIFVGGSTFTVAEIL